MTSETILLISVGYGPQLVDANLIDSLRSKATVKQATTVSEAMSMLINSSPHAVCITDGGITTNKQTGLATSLVDYTKSGGMVIFASSFSSFVRPNDVQPRFAHWDLSWKAGSYTRDTSVLNPRNSALTASGLPREYYAKALFLENVADSAKIYNTNPGSADHVGMLGSLVEASETFAAYSQVESGFVGFLGDVNPGTENEKVLLAMCGLADNENAGRLSSGK